MHNPKKNSPVTIKTDFKTIPKNFSDPILESIFDHNHPISDPHNPTISEKCLNFAQKWVYFRFEYVWWTIYRLVSRNALRMAENGFLCFQAQKQHRFRGLAAGQQQKKCEAQ